jgi:hypothetical protein
MKAQKKNLSWGLRAFRGTGPVSTKECTISPEEEPFLGFKGINGSNRE